MSSTITEISYEEYEAKLAAKRAKARELRTDPNACAQLLWKLACDDTSGSRGASALLLSLWNNHFKANMRDVMAVLDIQHTEAALGLLEHMGPGHWPERYLTEEQIEQVIKQWGHIHEVKRGNS